MIITTVGGSAPTPRDKTKSTKGSSNFQHEAQKEKAPRFLRGLIFMLFSLSTFGIAQASPLTTNSIIQFRMLAVKSAFGGFVFIPALSEAKGRVLFALRGL